MKRLCSLFLALVFAFSLSFAQDAMKPQDTQTPPAKSTMKKDKKKMAKAKKKVAKDKMKTAKDKKKMAKAKKKVATDKKMKKSSMMKADSTK
jgi:hypothetical protein